MLVPPPHPPGTHSLDDQLITDLSPCPLCFVDVSALAQLKKRYFKLFTYLLQDPLFTALLRYARPLASRGAPESREPLGAGVWARPRPSCLRCGVIPFLTLCACPGCR